MDVEALACEVYPWRKHVQDDESYWVTGGRAAEMTGVPLSGDPVSRLADRETYREQQPEDEWQPPEEPTPEETRARQQERIRRLLEMEEAGLVRITRHEGGAWSVAPVGQQVVEGVDDGEH